MTMNCEKCRVKISEYVDSHLSVNEAEEFLMHIESCPECKKELEQTLQAIDELHKSRQAGLPQGFYARMNANLDKVDAEKQARGFNWMPVFRMTAGAFALIAVTFIARQVYKQEMESRLGTGLGSRNLKVAEQGAVAGNEAKTAAPVAGQPELQAQDKAVKKTAGKDAAKPGLMLEAVSVAEKRKSIEQAKMMRSAAPEKAVELSEEESVAAADEAVSNEGVGMTSAAPAAALPAAPAADMYSKAEAAPQAAVKKAPAPRILEWQGIEGSSFEGGQEIKTAEELNALLESDPGIKNENPAIARFDFTDRMLVVIFAGEKPTAGFRVQIHDFDFVDGKWIVNYSVVAPPAGSITAQVITKPYLIRSFKKTEYGMEFVKH